MNARPNSLRRSLRFAYHGLIEPRSAGEDDRRREYILNIVLVGSIAMLLLLDAVVLYYAISWGPQDHGVSFAAFSMIPAFFVFLLALSRHGRFVSSSYLLIAAYFLSESYAVIRWTADMPPALLGYALTIMLASILVDTRFGFVVTGVVGAFLISIHYLQLHAVIASDASWKQNASVSDALVFAALLFLIMTVAWLSNREIERSLFRARKSERELQHERDFLEVKVEERTQELRQAQFEKIEQVNQFAKFGQLASGLFHDMLNIMNTLSVKIDVQTHDEQTGKVAAEPPSESVSATTKQIRQFMQAIRKQLNRQESSETFSVKESIEQVIQLLSYKANRESVRVLFAREEAPDIAQFGNPFRFHQVMFNLVLNAIESHESVPHDPERARSVTICIDKKNDDAIIRIEDRGCGIDESARKKIFDPFFSTKTEPRGMGIGLSSTKKIIEEDFHGIITVTDNGGNGSVFTVTFPIKKE
jgi:signal transduction histidine kinase